MCVFPKEYNTWHNKQSTLANKLQTKKKGMDIYLCDLEVLLGQSLGGLGVLRRQLLAVPAPRCVELHQKSRVLQQRYGSERTAATIPQQ